MKTYLVTGGAGFIGSHLVEKLLSSGNKVIVLDNFNDFYPLEVKINNVLESLKIDNREYILSHLKEQNSEKKAILNELKLMVDSENYTLEIIDIRDFSLLDQVFKSNRIDYVINLASLAGVRPSLKDPLLYEEVNVKGFMNILESCKKYAVKKVIQASSSSVYGNNKTLPFKETDAVDFSISPYAATKKSCEVMGHVYHKLYNIDMVQLRFFTVYGPRQRPDLAIYKFTKLISEGKEIPFYGDGSTERDYTYIDDIIDGITKAASYLKNNNNTYEIFNLGENNTISLYQMVNEIENELYIKARLNILPMQPGDVHRTNADITKARNLLGYNPKTGFKEGIKKFIKWYQLNYS